MYEFKKGDRVRIRDDIGTIKYEPPGINGAMRQMGGKVCTIRSISLSTCTLNEVEYYWLYKWLEPYEEEPDIDIAALSIADIL